MLCAGGQKSKQEKKEEHKAKLKAKKGSEAAEASTLSKDAPTAEALAAVGASQMSQAAAGRQAEIDKKKTAWQQRTQAATAASGEVAGPTQNSGDLVGPSQQTGDDGAAPGDPDQGAAAESPASAEDASSGSSEAEEDGEVDVADGAQVWLTDLVVVSFAWYQSCCLHQSILF